MGLLRAWVAELLWALLVGALLFACEKSKSDGSASQPVTQAAVVAFYRERCSGCHGETGAGDGAAAINLTPKPRSFRDAGWQASIKDPDLRRVILRGGSATGKSLLMPPNPDLETKTAMLDGIVEYVRAFGK